jgi:hypothetical protein
VRRIVLALIVVLSGISAHAQTTQVWPELSVFTRLNDSIRCYFLATTVKESQESTEASSVRISTSIFGRSENASGLASSAWMNRRTDPCCSESAIDTSIRSQAIPTNIASCSRQRPAIR